MSDLLVLVVAIIALGFLIIVHEGGHYFVARWCRMQIDRFSIGFGPGLLKKTSKTGTVFQLAPIPFGGFVEIRGMNIAEEVDPNDREAYPNRPAWQRFLTIFAGPATNYLSAIVIAMALYTCHGIDLHNFSVAVVMEHHDAYGKLEPDDRILEVNHVPLYFESGSELSERVNQFEGAPITLTIERDGQLREVQIKPQRNTDTRSNATWLLGVSVRQTPQSEVAEVSIFDAARHALAYPVDQTKRIGKALYGIVFGKEKPDLGGPIRIVEEFHKAFSDGTVYGIKLVMMLSVYLGLFNLLPIPALDGGRLVFLIYEMVTRRRANPKIETMVHMAGVMALGVLMLVVFYIDIRRLWT